MLENNLSIFGSGVDSSKITIYIDWKYEEYKEIADAFATLCGDATIIYNYKEPREYEDWDFIGFTFNNYHSVKDLKIYHTSNGSRYQMEIKGASKDSTA
jgi:hypothetical protein